MELRQEPDPEQVQVAIVTANLGPPLLRRGTPPVPSPPPRFVT